MTNNGLENVDSDGFMPRARKGGAIGANGEFYKGGQFIANSEDTVKGASMSWEPLPKTQWQIEQEAEIAKRVEEEAQWLAGRVAQFADLLHLLEGVQNVFSVYESFHQSLARQFKQTGVLSPKQAHCVANFFFGRRTKKNAEDFLRLVENLQKGGR